MKSFRFNNFIFAGFIVIAAGSLVFASPAPSSPSSVEGTRIENYDYEEYSDDQSAPSHQTKTPAADSIAATSRPFFPQPEITVTGVKGKNVTLECNAKDLAEKNVILWYKGEKLLTNDHHVLNPEFGVDLSTNALHIGNATESSQGDYFCEILPQKIRLHTILMIAEHPIESIVPESSISSQDHCQLGLISLLVPFLLRSTLV